ncbi:hypothetical protein [Leclercia adecarboxylata]|uniref:hypothetical protein n=1 Tax=Leclercia adecarboxylata TaxID=83655 RepID=UPI00384FA897
MATYTRSLMDKLYYEKGLKPWIGHSCEVRIDGTLISVTYITDDGKFAYSGSEQAPGIHTLKGNDDCDATLYGTEKSKIMYGGWKSGASIGLWKIILGISD